MTKVQPYGGGRRVGSQPGTPGGSSQDREREGKFSRFMDRVADASLETVSTVAPAFPGGEVVKMAADGLQRLRGETPSAIEGPGGSEQFEQMWEMQRQNQVYNMQYLQLQQEAQAQNRRFKTLSNLMKVRHDTAKSAINNMRA